MSGVYRFFTGQPAGVAAVTTNIRALQSFGEVLTYLENKCSPKSISVLLYHAKGEAVHSATAYATFTGNPADALFPCTTFMNRRRKRLMTAFRRHIKYVTPRTATDKPHYTLSLRLVHLLHLAENLESILAAVREGSTSVGTALSTQYGIDLLQAVKFVGNIEQQKNVSDCYDAVVRLLPPPNPGPLVNMMTSDLPAAKSALESCGEVLERAVYLKGTSWTGDHLPHFWLMPVPLNLRRGPERVLEHLAPTTTIDKVSQYSSYSKPLLLWGESGSGKTCALLAAGGKGHDLHIAAESHSIFRRYVSPEKEEVRGAAMKSYIDSWVVNVLSNALAQSEDNDDVNNPLRVMLHIDEVNTTSAIRDLIHAAEALQEVHTCGKEKQRVSLQVSVAVAGTGLVDLHNGAVGSIEGKFELLMAQPPSKEQLKDIAKLYVCGNSTVDWLMDQWEFTRVISTNMRLLSFTLRWFEKSLRAAATTAPEATPEDTSPALADTTMSLEDEARYKMYARRRDNLKLVGAPFPQHTVYTELLRGACVVGANCFVTANGLANMTLRMRQALLQVTHAAHLKRVVFIRSDTKEERSALSDAAKSAGFTPLPCDPNDATDDNEAAMVRLLQRAGELGLYTTTAREVRPNYVTLSKVRAELKSQKLFPTSVSVDGSVVAVPTDQPPLQMSTAYRVLRRLYSGTLFTKGSPADFEDLQAELVYEGLVAVAMVDGGCSDRTLLSVLGEPDHSASLKKPKQRRGGNLPCPSLKELHFKRVVRVALDYQLKPANDYYSRTAVRCAEALLEQYPATESEEELRGVLKEKAPEHAQQLRPFLLDTMFVLVPLERSPSADVVLICVSDKTPYAGGLQIKRNTKHTTINLEEEVDKMSEENKSMFSLMELAGAEFVDCFLLAYQYQDLPAAAGGKIVPVLVHDDVKMLQNDRE